MIKHIFRAIGLMKYRKIEEVIPYYCESLIHLELLFHSGIISFDGEKVHFHYSEESFQTVAKDYI
jgi:hypothetical protein